MRRDEYTDEELAMLTPAERAGLLDGRADDPTLSDRDRHLAWCKERAFEYLDREDCRNASSFLSDLRKHEGTHGLASGGLALIGMMDAASGDARAVEQWIEGFN